jgi:membrane associated rhomboid family serine protease
MKIVLPNFFASLTAGPRLLLALFALGFPLALAGHYTHAGEILPWLAFSPQLVWKGQVWRLLSYAFVPAGILDWLVSLFWLTTLVCVLARNWHGRELWLYCLLSTLAASLLLTLIQRPGSGMVAGNGAMILALLVAWERLYRRERIVLLGMGEMSVRQAAVIVAAIEVLLLFCGSGLLVTLAMIFGGAVGWLYLCVRGKSALNRRSQVLDSARMARLEM